MRQVAEKCQPVESLDRDPEDIDIDSTTKISQMQTYLSKLTLRLNSVQISDKVHLLKVKHKKLRIDEQGWKRLRMRRQGSRVDGLKTFQVVRENGVIRHRVTFRSCMPNSRGKDYRHGHHSKMKKSGSWLSG